MTYTIVIHKDSSGFWCASKHYSDNTVGSDYAFAISPEAVDFKLQEDGEEQEHIVVDD